ncbi:beta-1,3-galactosyltransferase 1-like [Tiliqua scincoides]|uniref:beta-1,3-galactosyltransferase 1-like n=1 Tax=Tiliqua scincoides TaxID=71010 RepID=UPI0034632C93
MKMLKFHLQSLSTVMLYILCSIFLVLLVVKTEMEAPETFSFLLKLPMKPQSSLDNPRDLENVQEFQWEADVEKSIEVKPLDVQPLTPAATRHPLQVDYPSNYQFRLNEPNKCLKRTPFLVLLVITEPKDVATRHAIRQTWGNENSIPGFSILRLFLTGVHPIFGSLLQNILEEESVLYRDIIQQDFLDTYNNLTLKTLMGMEWISKFCPNATYVMKADSDIFLNVKYLVFQLLQPHLPPKKDYITGYIYRNTKPIRNKAYKWYVPKEVYPNNSYPPYPGGPGYVLSGDLAKKIYQVAQTIKVINMEDSFTGICLHELGVNVTDSPWGLFNVFKIKYETCRFSKLVVVHHYGPEELLKIWPDFQGQNKTCGS